MKVPDMALNLPRYGFPVKILFHKCPQIYFYPTFVFSQDKFLKKWGNEAEIVKISKIFGGLHHEATIVYTPLVSLSIDENSLQECNP